MPDAMTLSWSRLKDYESCHHRVLKKLQGHRATVQDGRNFLAGTTCDRIMRRFLEHDDPQPGMMMSWLDEMLDHYSKGGDDKEYVIRWRGNPAEDKAKVRATCVNVLTNLEPLLYDKVMDDNYESELRFGFRGTPSPVIGVPGLDGAPRPVKLIGGIDILTQRPSDGTFRLYDLKATENDAYVRGSILGQLTFYSIVVKVLFGQLPVEAGFIVPGTKEKYVPVEIGAEELRTMYGRIEAYCHGVWRREWEPKDEIDYECTWCDVKHACELFKLPEGQNTSFAALAAQRREARQKKGRTS